MEKVAPSGSARPTQSGLDRGPDWVTRRFALGGRCEASGLGLADRRGAQIFIYWVWYFFTMWLGTHRRSAEERRVY